MIQKVLLYAYIFLGVAGFCYWISALLAVFKMLANRREGKSLLAVATTGILNEANFTVEGNRQRKKLVRSIWRFCLIIAAMVIVVLIGVQTQT